MKCITKIFPFILLFVSGYGVLGQSLVKVQVNGHQDCVSALSVNPEDTLVSELSPKGYGRILEIKDNTPTNPYYFEKEHNTAWYKMMMPYRGNLVFTLTPDNPEDDYDFILFKYDGKGFCKRVSLKQAKPVRSNISRNDKSIGSKTGLNLQSTIRYKNAGPGESFSKSVKVREKEIYYLVIDNVYDGGSSHRLIFNFLKDDGTSAVIHALEGIIKSEDGTIPVNAEVVIENIETGEVIARAKTDSVTGKYRFELPAEIDISKNYNLTVFADKHFFEEKTLTPAEFKQKKVSLNPLQRLKKGKSFHITNINFFSDSPQYLPESEPVLKKLVRLMEKNPDMYIEIEGHINGCTGSPDGRQLLSESRARTVFDYLERHGIDGQRMTTVGYGCTKMIYPEPKNNKEKKINRRVEIKITKY